MAYRARAAATGRRRRGGLTLLELFWAVPRGQILGETTDAQRWLAVAFGAAVQPFGLTALRHARMRIDDDGLGYLGFGLVCTTRTLSWHEVRRWGHATTSNRGRREPHLLFGRHDGHTRLVKLAMYAEQARIRAELERRLGAPSPAVATMAGVEFTDPR